MRTYMDETFYAYMCVFIWMKPCVHVRTYTDEPLCAYMRVLKCMNPCVNMCVHKCMNPFVIHVRVHLHR